jgi:hypothetical protein
MILAITLAVALILMGAIAGGLAVVVVGIHREEKAKSITAKSPSRALSGVRAINGVCVRSSGMLRGTQPSPTMPQALVFQGTKP